MTCRSTVVADGVLERVATTVTPRPMITVGRQRVVAIEDLRRVDVPRRARCDLRSGQPGHDHPCCRVGGCRRGGGRWGCRRLQPEVRHRDCRPARSSSLVCRVCRMPRPRSESLAAGACAGSGRAHPRHTATTTSISPARSRARARERIGGIAAENGGWVDEIVDDPIAGRSESLNVARGSRGAVLRGRPPAEVLVNQHRVRAALCFTCAR